MNTISVTGMRISTSMQSQALLEQLRANTLAMFNDQQQLSSGKRIALPSDDAAGATQALRLSDLLERYTQLSSNARYAGNFSAMTETALSDVRDGLNQASSLASQNAGSLVTADERSSAATIVDGIINGLLNVANRQYQGIYLFAGQQTDKQPFVEDLNGIVYQGDTNSLKLNLDGSKSTTVGLRGDQVFGALTASQSSRPLSPCVAAGSRTMDLPGAAGSGIHLGTIQITDFGGAGLFTVDLSQAATLQDVVDKINDASATAGSGITASLSTYGITVSNTAPTMFSITEQGNGTAAADLGIKRTGLSPDTIDGQSLQPKVALTTPLDQLNGGAGIDAGSGLILSNGGQTVTVDISGAQTVQDVLNAINGTNLGVLARVNAAGTGIEVLNRLSGGQLTIGENGGTTASDLGIRSLDGSALVQSLNGGRGIGTAGGADIRITAKDGSTVDVDLDGCTTVQDIFDRINDAAAAAGVNIAADLASTGNGIRISDTTGGAGDLQVKSLNNSFAAEDLGLGRPSSDTELVGTDVNPQRTDGLFTVLADLRDALRANDTAGITRAGTELGQALEDLAKWQGQAGAMSKSIQSQGSHLDDATLSAKTSLSDVQDIDISEAVTRFAQAQTTLQANLMTGSKLMQLSLLDFLQ